MKISLLKQKGVSVRSVKLIRNWNWMVEIQNWKFRIEEKILSNKRQW